MTDKEKKELQKEILQMDKNARTCFILKKFYKLINAIGEVHENGKSENKK